MSARYPDGSMTGENAQLQAQEVAKLRALLAQRDETIRLQQTQIRVLENGLNTALNHFADGAAKIAHDYPYPTTEVRYTEES